MQHQRCRTRVRRGRTRRCTGDATAHASSCVPLRRAMWIPRAFSWLAPMWLQLGPIRAESGRLGPESAVSAKTDDSGRNSKKKKKKKGVKRTIWLISKPYFSLVSHKRQNISFHLSSHFVSLPLCALCLSASILSPLWLWDTQPLGTHSVRCFNSFFL